MFTVYHKNQSHRNPLATEMSKYNVRYKPEGGNSHTHKKNGLSARCNFEKNHPKNVWLEIFFAVFSHCHLSYIYIYFFFLGGGGGGGGAQ